MRGHPSPIADSLNGDAAARLGDCSQAVRLDDCLEDGVAIFCHGQTKAHLYIQVKLSLLGD